MLISPGIVFTRAKHAELVDKYLDDTLAPDEILTKTIVSCVSSGSECGGYSDFFGGNPYPMDTGYISIQRVIKAGESVGNCKAGDIVFARPPHQLYSKISAAETLPLPDGMPPEHAALARFPAVSMSTLVRTQIKPTEPALVAGLGIVGLFCAQMFKHCGYTVVAVDKASARRDVAAACGLKHVCAEVDESLPYYGTFGLGIDCTGGDGVVATMVPAIRKGGELSLTGVPWRRTSDKMMHDFTYAIFYKFLTVYSGFEWCLPIHSQPFLPNSNYHLFEKSMEWIHNGHIKVKGVYALHDPRKCDEVYQQISSGTLPTTAAIFDWRSF